MTDQKHATEEAYEAFQEFLDALPEEVADLGLSEPE